MARHRGLHEQRLVAVVFEDHDEESDETTSYNRRGCRGPSRSWFACRSSRPRGAEVRVDGRPAKRDPSLGLLEVVAGEHDIDVARCR